MPKLNIAFAGSSHFAAFILESLLKAGLPPSRVYTQPDRPAGRGLKMQATPVKIFAEKQNIPVSTQMNWKDSEQQADFAKQNFDVFVVVAYGCILPQNILDTPGFGSVNIHASLLPRWRGAAPIERAIEAGDTTTGISLIAMNAKLDAGNILLKKSLAIEPDDTSQSLSEKLMQLAGDSIIELLQTPPPYQGEIQDESLVTYAHKILPSEAWINWQESAETIYNRFRAFAPRLFLRTKIASEPFELIFRELELADATSTSPQAFIASIDKQGMLIQTLQGKLLAKKIQFPSKAPQEVAVIHGHIQHLKGEL